jgi:hypothetical protein
MAAVLAISSVTVASAQTFSGQSASASDPHASTVLQPAGLAEFAGLSTSQIADVLAKETAADALSAQMTAATGVSPQSCPEVVTVARQVSPLTVPCLKSLLTYARQQTKSFYCGPASVEVISNFAWAVGSSSNKWSQQYISTTWTLTDDNGQTSPYYERQGLNGAVGSHHPSGFTYSYYQITSGADWQGKMVEDIGVESMPLAASVAPHDPGQTYYLPSWPNAITAGHWVAVNGYYLNNWDGSLAPTVYYDDSSAGYGGNTGSYATPSLVMYTVIMKSNADHSPKYIVW